MDSSLINKVICRYVKSNGCYSTYAKYFNHKRIDGVICYLFRYQKYNFYEAIIGYGLFPHSCCNDELSKLLDILIKSKFERILKALIIKIIDEFFVTHPTIYSNFIRNLTNFSTYNSYEACKKHFLNSSFYYITWFFDVFNWTLTPEGCNYWSDVNKKVNYYILQRLTMQN